MYHSNFAVKMPGDIIVFVPHRAYYRIQFRAWRRLAIEGRPDPFCGTLMPFDGQCLFFRLSDPMEIEFQETELGFYLKLRTISGGEKVHAVTPALYILNARIRWRIS